MAASAVFRKSNDWNVTITKTENTVAMSATSKIDLKTRKPVVANRMGGFSGPAIFPVAVRMVYQVANAVKVPVVGMGGVSSPEDVIEMMLAGATAVEVGAANLVDPLASKKIIEALPDTLDKYGINNISEIIGGVK